MVLIGGPPPPWGTCVIMLAAPPAAVITYVKDCNGLEPSLYGGGGSLSSESLSALPSLLSRGRLAFVSATTVEVTDDEDDCASGDDTDVKAGGGSEDGPSVSTVGPGELDAE